MQRRDFFGLSAALAARQAPLALAASPPLRMKLGTQHGESDEILRTMAAFGVNHICAHTPSKQLDAKWSVEALTQLRERIEKFGLTLEMIELPTNSYIATSGIKNVMLGKSPERDREIDGICQMIRNISRAGIPRAKYNMTILAVVRTEPTPGRGGAMYSTWDYAKAKEDPPLTEAGPVSADLHWERITHFLERVAPAAEEYKVKIGCHPHDPAIPGGKPYRGVYRVMASVEGLKRFISIKENSYHGLNFCQGTVSEMLDRPQPRALAALILCEATELELVHAPDDDLQEGRTSREFVLWYQKLLQVKAQPAIERLHEQTERLSSALPTAAGIIEKVLFEMEGAR